MPLQHEHTLNPVTALAFYSHENGTKFLIAGEGSYLRIFEVETLKPVLYVKVFSTQTIHGISAKGGRSSQSDLDLIIWGGTSFALLTRRDVDLLLSQQYNSLVQLERNAPDWLLDGAISSVPGQERSCIFVTAHSSALHISLSDNVARPQLSQLSSPSRSVLYSAAITWTSDTTFMVAAGTVFGEIEIILWNINSELGRILHTFTGHEGSIFGVTISPEIQNADGRSVRLLASCSDDRTVRLWEIEEPSEEQKASVSHQNPDAAMRETGFGQNLSDSITASSEDQCLAVRMGHISRIWGVKFLLPDNGAQTTFNDINVLSFGEDATVHQWRLDDPSSRVSREISKSESKVNGTTKSTLNLVKVFAYHSGKHLWSSALLCKNGAQNQLATGGADGKISIYPISVESGPDKDPGKESLTSTFSNNAEKGLGNQTDQAAGLRSWTLQEILSSRSSGLQSSGAQEVSDINISENLSKTRGNGKQWKDALNQFIFITRELLLVTTWSKKLFLGPYKGAQGWKELNIGDESPFNTRSYWELTSIPEKGVAFAGCINTGVIYIISLNNQPQELFQVEGKIVGLFSILESGDRTCQILVTTADCQEAAILSVNLDKPSLASIGTVELPQKFVLRSAKTIQNFLILGSREGEIAIYDAETEASPKLLNSYRLPSHETITAIVPIPSANQTGGLHFLVTVRDGTYAVFYISKAADITDRATGVAIKLVHQGSPPFGPWIEAAWFENSTLYLYGFRSKNFVVWNETDQVEVMNVDCGGAHRNVAYASLSSIASGGAGNFAFNRAGKLHLYLQVSPSHQVMKRGGHGREIKAGALLEKKDFLATGAEDTSIRLWRLHSSELSKAKDYECCAVINKHVTGIQDLQWSHREGHFTYLFSAAGYEEFYVWAISDVPGFGLGVICEATLEDISEEHDLRIMAFDVLPNPHIQHPRTQNTMEDSHLICLAFSDSTIKAYLYSKEMGFSKIAHGRYTSSCLTQLKILPYEHKTSYRLLTASTDGHLALWDFPEPKFSTSTSNSVPELTLLSRTPVHQSSILALDILPLSQSKSNTANEEAFIIATGGDDNSIALTFFYGWKPSRRLLVPSAHAAAVTGLAFVKQQRGFERELGGIPHQPHSFCTVGEDQKVKRWRVELGFGTEGMEMKDLQIEVLERDMGDEVASSVADPAGLVGFGSLGCEGGGEGSARCLVYGNGFESFRVVDL